MGGLHSANSAWPGALALFATLAAGCTDRLPEPADAEISGTVTYRARMALPPDAVISVRLADISMQDAPADVMAEAEIPAAGRQVPIPFHLSYQPGRIDPAKTYGVSARILIDGRMTMTSTAAYPVLTRGAPDTVDILVSPLGTQSAEAESGAE